MVIVNLNIVVLNGYLELADLARSVRTSRTHPTDVMDPLESLTYEPRISVSYGYSQKSVLTYILGRRSQILMDPLGPSATVTVTVIY